MIDWFSQNYQWLFSGVGVTAVVLFLSFLIRRRRSSTNLNQAPTPPQGNAAPTQESKPTADVLAAGPARPFSVRLRDIRKAIDAAPPLQQDDVAARYEGIRIRWKMCLWIAGYQGGDSVNLTLVESGFSLPFVSCEVKLAEYPELKILPEKSPVLVSGTIHAVTNFKIELQDVELSFPGSSR